MSEYSDLSSHQCRISYRVDLELAKIPLRHTTRRYGLTITRWQRGFEVGTIKGDNLLSRGQLADQIATTM